MWKVLPRFGLFKIVVLVVCFVFMALLLFKSFGWLGISEHLSGDLLEHIFSAVGGVTVITYIVFWLLGAVIWRPLWKAPWLGEKLNEVICPDLNGTWSGKTISTFENEDGSKRETPVRLTIKANFFEVKMELRSADGYQHSKVIQSEIYKDPRDGSFRISYIFESEVPVPDTTDDSRFYGSAVLNIRFEKDEIKLVGTYWTNRAWQRSGQTAGSISLKRQKN